MPPTQDLATPKIPRGLRSLGGGSLDKSSINNNLGHELQSEASAVERWWSQPRWQHTKRVYSGTYVMID